MESIVNTDGTGDTLSPATTITVIDPEATEVTSFTSSVTDASANNVDDIAAQIVTAVNGNTETPIDFTAEYDSVTNTVILTAQLAGNTNPWTIVFNNNGATVANAGNLSTIITQTGQIINQIDVLTVTDSLTPSFINGRGQTYIDFSEYNDIDVYAGGTPVIRVRGNSSTKTFNIDADRFTLTAPIIFAGNAFLALEQSVLFNPSLLDFDFNIHKASVTTPAYNYNAGTDTTTIDSDVINFVGNTITGLPTGADGLSITDTVNLNLLNGTTVLSTVALPSAGGTTIVQGTTDEIDVTTVGDTNTISLATAITGAITANTAKTGISTAQATAITDNTAKTGITTAQATAITTNTAKVGITGAQANNITANTSKLAGIEAGADVTDTTNVVASLEAGTNIVINPITGSISATGDAVLANNQTFSGINTFTNNTAAGGISVRRITSSTTSAVAIDLTSNQIAFDVPIFAAPGTSAFLFGGTLNISTGIATFNPLNGDRDFEINKQTTGKALTYNAGTDTLTLGADNVVGITDSQSGTWTPVFNSVTGTPTTTLATYKKVGGIVYLSLTSTFTADGTSTGSVSILTSSFPFTNVSGTQSNGAFSKTGTGGIGQTVALNASVFFIQSDGTALIGTDITTGDGLGFSLTYITDE